MKLGKSLFSQYISNVLNKSIIESRTNGNEFETAKELSRLSENKIKVRNAKIALEFQSALLIL